jgi:hypothetical protein
VKEFLDTLSDSDVADIAAAMRDVQKVGIRAAKPVGGEIYEVKAEGDRQTFRVLFAQEGEHDQVLHAGCRCYGYLPVAGCSARVREHRHKALNR